MTARRDVFDLVIAGAGPVGLAVAIHARLRGLDAIVLERRREPLDKACGEGIMPAGVAALESMGVSLAGIDRRPFHGIRYVEDGIVAEGRFPGPPGLGLRRTGLEHALLARARELGAVVRTGSPLEGWEICETGVSVNTPEGTICGALLVGADGLHSRIRRLAGLDRQPRPWLRSPSRYGIRRHFAARPWSDLVEVHLADGAEAYVTPVGPETVSVAVLFTTRPAELRRSGTAASGTGPNYDALPGRFPALQERLAGAEPLDRVRGAGPFRQRVRARTSDRVALVGDAAGYVDALTGQGIELGFAAAEALADIVRSGAPLLRYEAVYRRITRRYYVGAEILLRGTRRGLIRRGLVRVLRSAPAVFDRAVGAL